MQQGPLRVVPPAVPPEGTVALVAPGSPVDPMALQRAEALLRSWGLRVEVGAHAGDRLAPPLAHLAGTDAHRRDDLLDAMTRPGVDAVVCARGGTAVGRVLAGLAETDWEEIAAASPRWFAGSSDATALHLALAARGLPCSAFTPMPASDAVLGPGPLAAGALRQALMAPTARTELRGAVAVGGSQVWAPVTGGTLSLIQSLLGSPDAGTAEGCIVLLEDVGEAPRRLDRALTGLRRSGWLDGALGIAVGTLVDCGATALGVVRERVEDLGVPVLTGLELGHGPRQRALPLGVPVLLDPAAATLSWGS